MDNFEIAIAILLTTYGVIQTTAINCNQLLNTSHLANQKHRIFFVYEGGGVLLNNILQVNMNE